jgi:glycosyltransferase involved in cell wall biosynthesis
MKIGYIMQEGGPDVRQVPLTGPARHVLRVFQELQRLGHDVRLLARYKGVLLRSDDLVAYTPVAPTRVDGGWRRSVERAVRGLQSRLRVPYFNYFESLRFAAACEAELSDRDVLFERLGWMGLAGGLAARRLRIPLVGEVNNGDFVTELDRLGTGPTGLQRPLAIAAMRRAVGRVDRFVATGDGHRDRFIEYWNVAPDSIVTVENGSELVDGLGRDDLASFARPLDPSAPVTFVFVGAFEPWHGILILLAAIRRFRERVPRFRLVLIGSGTLEAQIRAYVAEHRLDDVVQMTGQLDLEAAGRILATSDVGLAPYCGWMEFSGLKLFDYKAAGLAIVASGERGRPATLSHGHTALVVPPCSEDALVAALERVAGDAELRRALGQAARADAEQHNSWRHTARQIEAVLQAAVAARSRTRHP